LANIEGLQKKIIDSLEEAPEHVKAVCDLIICMLQLELALTVSGNNFATVSLISVHPMITRLGGSARRCRDQAFGSSQRFRKVPDALWWVVVQLSVIRPLDHGERLGLSSTEQRGSKAALLLLSHWSRLQIRSFYDETMNSSKTRGMLVEEALYEMGTMAFARSGVSFGIKGLLSWATRIGWKESQEMVRERRPM
jgi:hypothetical protein